MDIKQIIMKKNFTYLMIGGVLVGIFLFSFCINDLIILRPEIFGLIFTLLIFYVFFEWREKIEWKSFEERIEKKIGRQVYSLFIVCL